MTAKLPTPLEQKLEDAIRSVTYIDPRDGRLIHEDADPQPLIDLAKQMAATLIQMGEAIDWPPEGGGMIDHDDDDRCVATPLDFHHDCPVFVMSPDCPGCQALEKLHSLITLGTT